MTNVTFHFNVADRQNYICRLLRKAATSGAQVVVTGTADSLDAIDTALWNFVPTAFVPHCRAEDAPAIVQRSPILLTSSLEKIQTNGEALLNLSASVPNGFDQFSRLIEVVTFDETDKSQARDRWRRYAEFGMNLIRHDAQGGAT